MYKRILVPFDGSPTSIAGLDEAVKLAKLTGASIRIVHVLDGLPFSAGDAGFTGDILGILLEAGSQILVEGKRRVQTSGVPVDTFLSETFGQRVADVVAEQVKEWNADLIVIGTHGRRGVKRLFIGSDAEQIVRTAPVPVHLVRLAQGEAEAHVDNAKAA
jgi:nucleotide-binding universal stress UspA family protein